MLVEGVVEAVVVLDGFAFIEVDVVAVAFVDVVFFCVAEGVVDDGAVVVVATVF